LIAVLAQDVYAAVDKARAVFLARPGIVSFRARRTRIRSECAGHSIAGVDRANVEVVTIIVDCTGRHHDAHAGFAPAVVDA
jgi:hypothetical protein